MIITGKRRQVMGACFGRCWATVADRITNRSYQRHTDVSIPGEEQAEQNHRVPVSLELIEDTGWPGRSNKYARLTSKHVSPSAGVENPLQMLDPRGLIAHQASTAASSVDLEWEHEGLPMPITIHEKLEDADDSLSEPSVHNSQPSSLTASPWSRVSTPNSLEWDPVDADMVDVETETLLTEIERLTDRALKETGDWTANTS